MMQTTEEKEILLNSNPFKLKSIDGLIRIKDEELLNTKLHEQAMKSMSDDEICYNKYNNNDHDDSDQDEDDAMPPLTLRDASSAHSPFHAITTRKRRKNRSHSTQLTLNGNNKNKTIKTLKKKLKVQSDQVQLYQKKITDIQDEREDLEEKLRKEYELKRLHWETKYLQEKSQKSSLQHEIERLKQDLFVREQELKRAISVASNYSTGPGSVAATASPNVIPDTPFKRVSTNSVPTIRTNPSNNSSNSTITNNPNIGRKSSTSSSTTSSSNTTNASNTSNTTTSNDDDSSESESESDGDTESSTSDEEVKEEGHQHTLCVINTVSKNKVKQKKNQKIPKRLSQKLEKNQPKGFWQTVLYLFGPPDFDCSCSK